MEFTQKLKKNKIELPFDPAVLLRVPNQRKQNYISKRYMHPMLIAALCSIAKNRNHLISTDECPLMDEWKKKMWEKP